mmetsp:Transcript_8383/g.21410  ORF Transcript_8383/g.21410 Transcript_8383/m.21410 type:complete len:566 (+) Transcript_8383:63-1760(+)
MSHGAAIARASAVFCRGDLLDAVQRARLFSDSKHFVDMPMRAEPEAILAAFEAMPLEHRGDSSRLRAFVQEYFDEPGAELVPYTPDDCPVEPPLKAQVADPALHPFLEALHGLWPTLCRKVAPKVAEAPQRHSALPRRAPVVLPGGRFRETYYWDSYWIVEGLLASGMSETARGLVQNLLDDVEAFGFVPNGGRVYYLNRSQPPLLCDMVASVARLMDAAAAASWLPPAVRLLQKEHDYWMSDLHAVNVGSYKLNRYSADWSSPRPESYREDVETASGNAAVYREIATAAESGWDFSARWTHAGSRIGGVFSLRETAATRVLPVDLNAILYRAERTLAALTQAVETSTPLNEVEVAVASLGDSALTAPGAAALAKAAAERREAIDALMWKPAVGRWVDAWLQVDGSVADDTGDDRAPMLSDFAAPLWAGLADAERATAAVAALQRSGLLGVGGASTTACSGTEQQWDAPNAWPPLQSMLILGMRQLEASSGGPTLAAQLAQQWVGTCYAAWRHSGFMFEKYDSSQFGFGGGGGEYEPQVGFGWSNGVVLQLLRDYGAELVAKENA